MKFNLHPFSPPKNPVAPPADMEMKDMGDKGAPATQPETASNKTASQPPAKKEKGGAKFFPQLFQKQEKNPELAAKLEKLKVMGMETGGMTPASIDFNGKHALTAGQTINILRAAKFSRINLWHFANDINTMSALRRMETDPDLSPESRKEVRKQLAAEEKIFARSYSKFFASCDFKKVFIANRFEALKAEIERESSKQAFTFPSKISEEAQINQGLIGSLKQTFLDNLLKQEKVDVEAEVETEVEIEPEPQTHSEAGDQPEAHNYANQFIGARAEAMPIKPANYGTPIPNRGGGDCLLLALKGIYSMSVPESIELRDALAKEIGKSDLTPSYCANLLVAGMWQSPGFRAAAGHMEGRHEVPREVYADFIRIPGTYLGPAELALLTKLSEFKDKEILVADVDGSLGSYKDGKGMARLTREEFDQKVKSADQQTVLLFKSLNHWEQIRPAVSKAD